MKRNRPITPSFDFFDDLMTISRIEAVMARQHPAWMPRLQGQRRARPGRAA